jgi:hypothetical protein
MFNRIKSTGFDRCYPYLAVAFLALRSSMVINAIHIRIMTAFLVVPKITVLGKN